MAMNGRGAKTISHSAAAVVTAVTVTLLFVEIGCVATDDLDSREARSMPSDSFFEPTLLNKHHLVGDRPTDSPLLIVELLDMAEQRFKQNLLADGRYSRAVVRSTASGERRRAEAKIAAATHSSSYQRTSSIKIPPESDAVLIVESYANQFESSGKVSGNYRFIVGYEQGMSTTILENISGPGAEIRKHTVESSLAEVVSAATKELWPLTLASPVTDEFGYGDISLIHWYDGRTYQVAVAQNALPFSPNSVNHDERFRLFNKITNAVAAAYQRDRPEKKGGSL